ncbi:MAG: hypothetical protein NW216_03090 [Hyphomicrobium sp.]|nr:hypothetical protein [Hyphomicrobium sp.]
MAMKTRWLGAIATAVFCAVLSPEAARAERIKVKGEIVDTWCSITGIMFAQGTAHFQCAVWCAVGGIPVSIRTADDQYYVVLRIADDNTSVTNPTLVTIQAHHVTVDGELFERDGVKYLFVSEVADDKGIVNITHEDYGIQPFGN